MQFARGVHLGSHSLFGWLMAETSDGRMIPGRSDGRPKHDFPSKADVLDGKDGLGPLVGEGFVELFRLAELLVGH